METQIQDCLDERLAPTPSLSLQLWLPSSLDKDAGEGRARGGLRNGGARRGPEGARRGHRDRCRREGFL